MTINVPFLKNDFQDDARLTAHDGKYFWKVMEEKYNPLVKFSTLRQQILHIPTSIECIGSWPCLLTQGVVACLAPLRRNAESLFTLALSTCSNDFVKICAYVCKGTTNVVFLMKNVRLGASHWHNLSHSLGHSHSYSHSHSDD